MFNSIYFYVYGITFIFFKIKYIVMEKANYIYQNNHGISICYYSY